MKEKNFYFIPNKAGKKLILGQLFGSSIIIECANIINKYLGLILLITKDINNALQIYKEIKQLTKHPVFIMPNWNILPYSNISPNKDVVSERINTLYCLYNINRGVIIVPINSLMQKVCPYSFLKENIFIFDKNKNISFKESYISKLENIGYRKVNYIIEHGEFKIKNESIEIYPIANKYIYKINFCKNKINNINIIDINTKVNLKKISSFILLPANEFPYNGSSFEYFKKKYNKYFNKKKNYKKINKKNFFPGIEFFQPLFFDTPLSSMFDYLPKKTLILSTCDIKNNANKFWNQINFIFNKNNKIKLLLKPKTLWLCFNDFINNLKLYPRIKLSNKTLSKKENHYNMKYKSLPNWNSEIINDKKKINLIKFCKEFKGSIIFSVENNFRRNILNKILLKIKILHKIINHLDDITKIGIYLIISHNKNGFIDILKSRAIICENDIIKELSLYFYKNNYEINNYNNLKDDLDNLQYGCPVVHIDHGIGIYSGTSIINVDGIKGEYLIITYADNDKLYLPISSLNLITKYIGNINNEIILNKLGGKNWIQSKKQIIKNIKDEAAELLDLYSKRAIKKGFNFKFNKNNYQLFNKKFLFNLTIDQHTAINAVISDMCKKTTMDRLICGDVGFGKTEIAIRAAFLATENNKQVAILVPTTLLAQQHFETFKKRFSDWPVSIEMISRFKKIKDQKKILKKTANGKINILIGTHKLLQKNIKWKDLGLLIIDEEHCFGVFHKERIKTIHNNNIDILTLTATPIPRTLNMAFNGIRDLSIISTPPEHRRSIKTFLIEYDKIIIREAIIREISRGGQVLYLYNKVENIDKIAKKLKIIVPEAVIKISHGKLHERDLENIMNDFYHKQFNVLVCTTIIESGIDITNANTIIIERADYFGLAQLHQLRGRVGRSCYQAYAYLLTPPLKTLNNITRKRLEIFSSLKDLGSGFILSTYDLETRGAGEILGKNQSGNINTIGLFMYKRLLKDAINSLNSNLDPCLNNSHNKLTDIKLNIPAFIPEDYIQDVNTRLLFYIKINNSMNYKKIKNIELELLHKFGKIPDLVYYLLMIAKIRIKAFKIGIKIIEANKYGGNIIFKKNNIINSKKIIDLIIKNPKSYKLSNDMIFYFIENLENYKKRIKYINDILKKFIK